MCDPWMGCAGDRGVGLGPDRQKGESTWAPIVVVQLNTSRVNLDCFTLALVAVLTYLFYFNSGNSLDPMV